MSSGYFEEEAVDFELMMSFVDEVRSGSLSDELIDKFLELKDLRIVVEDDNADDCKCRVESGEVDPQSEELADIYYNQRLYSEAKHIYSRLFLLYSEKIAYFATQIEKIETIIGSDNDVNN